MKYDTKLTEEFEIEDGELKRYLGCEKQVTIPKGVWSIGEDAFENCTFLKKVILPEGLEIIKRRAFHPMSCR